MALVVFSFFLTLAFASTAMALTCPNTPPQPKISVRFIKAKPYLNNRASARHLKHKSKHRGLHGNKTIGLTESGLSLKVTTSFQVKSSNMSRNSCVTLDTIHIDYGFRKTMVLIDSRYRPGSCEYAAVYQHEAAHIRIMNTKGASYYNWLKQQIAKNVRSVRPVLTRRPRTAQRLLAAKVKRLAKALIKQMDDGLAAAHAIIDTPENYRRTQEQCSNW